MMKRNFTAVVINIHTKLKIETIIFDVHSKSKAEKKRHISKLKLLQINATSEMIVFVTTESRGAIHLHS